MNSALRHTCPAVSTSWRWYSCPFIVIILVNAANTRKQFFVDTTIHFLSLIRMTNTAQLCNYAVLSS